MHARHAALATQPIRTLPNTAPYEWAGKTLQQLFHTDRPVAESWPFFSGPERPARLAGTAAPLTLEQLVRDRPELLGPRGADPDNGGQKYFFVKFLDPSDFPAFAYVGFNPEAVAALRQPQSFPTYVAELLWQDRQLVEAFAEAVRARVTSAAAFHDLKAAYKQWAIAQAAADWNQPTSPQALKALTAFTDRGEAALASLLTRTQAVRRAITGLLHRIPFEDDQAILVETPTVHAIAGLSLQIHPKTPGNFFPKDEAWIYQTVSDAAGRRLGWVLVEPQRTFDKTESCADFFTPFAWTPQGLGFRKPITRDSLAAFVSLMDATPRDRAHYVREAAPMTVPGGSTEGAAQWYRVIDEPSWPYFVVRELRFAGAGDARTPLPHHSFSELHVTQGQVDVELTRAGTTPCRFTVSAADPALLPATLPYDAITYRAAAPARLSLITRPSKCLAL